ncbi:hypothetical protein M426DRAFT_158539 [Hypoxylon sp. CI-4A]|nr:hypothetical protein M426DRAFT_158539 [Hypoxylon sp. CI-4A]
MVVSLTDFLSNYDTQFRCFQHRFRFPRRGRDDQRVFTEAGRGRGKGKGEEHRYRFTIYISFTARWLQSLVLVIDELEYGALHTGARKRISLVGPLGVFGSSDRHHLGVKDGWFGCTAFTMRRLLTEYPNLELIGFAFSSFPIYPSQSNPYIAYSTLFTVLNLI